MTVANHHLKVNWERNESVGECADVTLERRYTQFCAGDTLLNPASKARDDGSAVVRNCRRAPSAMKMDLLQGCGIESTSRKDGKREVRFREERG
jgi:hypothetical protein